jgi:hypothetical protein
MYNTTKARKHYQILIGVLNTRLSSFKTINRKTITKEKSFCKVHVLIP